MKTQVLIKWTAIVLLWVATSCASLPVSRLPAYDAAIALAPGNDLRCFHESSTDLTQLPQLVPYATIAGTYPNGYSPERERPGATRAIAKEASKSLRPDVIILFEGGSFHAGTVGGATAFPVNGGAVAIGYSAPVYQNSLIGMCFRLATARLGFGWDETGMVVSEDDSARSSGLLEGDRIISIGASPVTIGAKWASSPHYGKLLNSLPGDELPIVWIRAGTGRMEGKLRLQANPPTHLQLEPIDLSPPPVRGENRPNYLRPRAK